MYVQLLENKRYIYILSKINARGGVKLMRRHIKISPGISEIKDLSRV